MPYFLSFIFCCLALPFHEYRRTVVKKKYIQKNQKISCPTKKGEGSPLAHNSIAERGVPELIPVLGSQPAGDCSHKAGGRLPLLSARPAVTLATLKRAATNFAAW